MPEEKIAIIHTGGKQYLVRSGTKLTIEKLSGSAGDEVVFDKVLLRGDVTGVEIGTPYLPGASVKGIIKAQGRDEKKVVFKYHSKTRYRKLKGHRQPYTEVVISSI